MSVVHYFDMPSLFDEYTKRPTVRLAQELDTHLRHKPEVVDTLPLGILGVTAHEILLAYVQEGRASPGLNTYVVRDMGDRLNVGGPEIRAQAHDIFPLVAHMVQQGEGPWSSFIVPYLRNVDRHSPERTLDDAFFRVWDGALSALLLHQLSERITGVVDGAVHAICRNIIAYGKEACFGGARVLTPPYNGDANQFLEDYLRAGCGSLPTPSLDELTMYSIPGARGNPDIPQLEMLCDVLAKDDVVILDGLESPLSLPYEAESTLSRVTILTKTAPPGYKLSKGAHIYSPHATFTP